MNITPAEATDCAALARIETLQPFSAQWGEEGFQGELNTSAARVWCAREGGNPVGFIAVRQAAGCAEILNVAVDPAYCRRGYGRALLAYALERLRALGVQHVTLEVNCNNRPAVSLYARLGFKEAGRRKNFYHGTEDALIMGAGL